eukprot:CAMPEP_0168345804 /NCGR_PEP_ID=MMETSP0213-20121227/17810_1 /TAXON_ID=151035 /ORGANISM="Euplotes harpa, Strain FSP1.4" /LENGTH=55 /DNA_ID=CAMNT_0008354167 /DNA_START=30 /DNA_END=193 /DNA_ORIENTATION=-
MQENESLKTDLENANTRVSEISEKFESKQEKYANLKDELKILKNHFLALEKEKAA